MKHLKKLSRQQKISLSKLNLNPDNFLRLTQDYESFTVVNIKTNMILKPIKY